jgi:hypothetical protein
MSREKALTFSLTLEVAYCSMEHLERIKIAKFSTPWGLAQTIKQFGDLKVYQVTTWSHGGVMIHFSEIDKFTPNCISRAWKVGSYFCYEEDCCACIPLYEWCCHNPTLYTRKILDTLHREISYNWAEYLIERGIEPELVAYQRWLDHNAYDEAIRQKDPNCIKAFDYDLETRVQTADGKWHFVPRDVLENAKKLVWWGLFLTHIRAVGGEHLCR